jgi:hypothetical protein
MSAIKPKNSPLARVEAIIARNAPVAVIFRRGPSRLVRMLTWDLRKDRIEGGQWMNARLRVDLCDVSPNGKLVACFVVSYRKAPGTWTAISRPPNFSALAVWPVGDSWGNGGGLFTSDTHFLLSHDTEVMHGVDRFKLLPDFALPKRFRVQPFRGHSPVPMCGVEQARMVLSGWRFAQRATIARKRVPTAELSYPFEQPEIMTRPLDDPNRRASSCAALNSATARDGRARSVPCASRFAT